MVGGWFVTIWVSTLRAENKFETRKLQIQDMCQRYNEKDLLRRNFKLTIGPNTAYFVIRNQKMGKQEIRPRTSSLYAMSARIAETLPTFGDESQKTSSEDLPDTNAVNIQDQQGVELTELKNDP